MKLISCLIFVITFVTSAKAAVVLTFEGLGNNEPVENYYNGGFGGNGSGPGPNYGITFLSNANAIISDLQENGSGNFAGTPSGDTALSSNFSGINLPSIVMNDPAGFTTGLALYYASAFYPGTVTVYSGLDLTGTVLTTLYLPSTPTGFGSAVCQTAYYCPFYPAGVAFSGTAESVAFSGYQQLVVFDDITLGSATPVGMAPEPATWALLGVGLLIAVVFHSRRREDRTIRDDNT